MSIPTLETDRLILRPVTEADAPAIFAACSNPNVTRYTRFDTHRSMGDTLRFLRDYAGPNYAKGLPDPLGWVLKSDPAVGVIGTAGVRWASEAHRTMECGYWLAEPYWGRGLATEAVRAVARYALEAFPIHRLQAHVVAANAASSRVLEKAGFAFEGVLRQAMVRRGNVEDVRMYSMVQE
ncbi:MAG TPA: GNAT family N-acetyltransferase [Fimbriiglobus sp.]